MSTRAFFFFTALIASIGIARAAEAASPHASHVIIVVMENRNYRSVAGDDDSPYFNGQLVPQGALLTNSHAIEHPSQPNYLDLFSGSNQGVTDDSCPHAFAAPNLATRLAETGRTFVGYSESLPNVGYDRCSYGRIYARKHAPWVNFTNVPAQSNRPLSDWPGSAPDVAWITPNMCNDMHDCPTRAGDDWMRAHLPHIIAWNAAHNGLLIITWDESGYDLTNHIPTLLIGPMIAPGTYAQRADHFDVLHTIETIFGLRCLAKECAARDLSGMWR